MAATGLTVATSVFAADTKTVNVEFSVYDGGYFTMTPEIIKVSADLDDKYAEAIGYNDADGGVTVYDAVIAAHIRMFGEDFSEYAPMKYSGGMLSQSFGEETTALGYRINGAMDDGSGNYYNLDTVLKDGDSVEYMFYQDAYYGDKYTRFNKRRVSLHTGESLTLNLTVESYDENWNTVKLPAANMSVYIDGVEYGKTDSKGNFTYKFNTVGEFGVTVKGQYSDDLDDYEIFAPYCTVNVTTRLYDYVEKEEAAAAEKLFGDKKEFTVDDSYSLVTLINSGCDVSAYAEKYAESVKANLDKNSGKLLASTGKEDIGLYGAVIICLEELGYDTTDFYSYDIEATMESLDIVEARTHQYHYQYAIQTATPDRARAIIDDLIATYYTKGKGMDNWGYSCDNACKFLIAVAPYADEYKEYVDDAKTVIKSYLLKDGAFCDPVWSKNANGDSTALSMAAFASVNDVKTAFSYYKLLVNNFEAGTGLFSFEKGGKYNDYATNDALFSLYYFKKAVAENSFEHPEHINTVIKGYPATFKKAGKTDGCYCKICGHKVAQKTIAKLKAASLKKVKKGKKSFVATWTKVSGVDGYQIQYSTNKKFKKMLKGKKQVVKKVKVKKAKTTKKKIKKLKAKKTYYVRIRAYKKINGKVKYSKWSKVKKVKTK